MEEEKKEKQWDPLHKPLLSKSIALQQKFNNVTSSITNTLNVW